MAIGERIHFFRNLRGMTQKYLGTLAGFPEKSADVRLAQYESGTRTPKAELTTTLADVLDVSHKALDIPDIDTYDGLLHTLFALEDMHGLKIGEIDGELCLRLDKTKGSSYHNLFSMFSAWQEQATKLSSGEISQEDYDRWRYHYPKYDTTQIRASVPSQALGDLFVDGLKEN